MSMTNSERQAAFRQRRDDRLLELEEAVARLTAENYRLRNGGHGPEILVWRNFNPEGVARWRAETQAGSYAACPSADAGFFEAHLSPWDKSGTRRRKTKPLGTFKTPAEAKAACEEHAETIT